MQVQHIGHRIRGFYRVAALGHLWEMTPKDAQQRLKILHFFEKHGEAATQDAFGVSRRTLYRWKATWAAAGGNPAALAARSCAPRRRRTPTTPPVLIEEIRALRRRYPNLGKAKLHVLLAPWCQAQGIAWPSVSTIARLIARAPDKMRHAPRRLDARGRPKPVRRTPKPRKPKALQAAPMHLWAADTIERVRDGVRRYLLTFLDPVSRIGLAVALPTKASRHTRTALEALLTGLHSTALDHAPEQRRAIVFLSDNGSEFQGEFDQFLTATGLTHYWTAPRSPKMNAHNERFNRTLQEQFVDFHEDLLFTDLAAFNRQLADWLIQYNTVIPHHSLGLQSPIQWLLHHHPECQRYWTHT